MFVYVVCTISTCVRECMFISGSECHLNVLFVLCAHVCMGA